MNDNDFIVTYASNSIPFLYSEFAFLRIARWPLSLFELTSNYESGNTQRRLRRFNRRLSESFFFPKRNLQSNVSSN